MRKFNLIGQRFGQLLVTSEAGVDSHNRNLWECSCDCGGVLVAPTAHIKSRLKDCGCGYEKKRGYRHKSHGMSKKIPEYSVWENMKRRCYYHKSNRYKNYGARGITVCERWRTSFENFYNDMGRRPSSKHSIERKNVNIGYSPSNCVWATIKQQTRNTTRNIHIEINGVKRCLTDWINFYMVSKTTVYRRIKNGFALDEKLFMKKASVETKK